MKMPFLPSPRSRCPRYDNSRLTLCIFQSLAVTYCLLQLIRVACPVNISVTSPVVVFLPADEVNISCDFSSEPPCRGYMVFWKKGVLNSSKVISRYASGKIIPGVSYAHRAWLQNGCSITLDNPRVNDSDTYTVDVVCIGDSLSQAVVNVDVIVLRQGTVATTATITTGLKLDTATNSRRSVGRTETSHAGKHRDSRDIVVTLSVCLTSLGICVLLGVIFGVLHKAKRHERPFMSRESFHKSDTDGESLEFIPEIDEGLR